MKKSLFRSVVCSVEINIVTYPSHFAPVKPTRLASSKAGVSCFFFPTNTTSQNSDNGKMQESIKSRYVRIFLLCLFLLVHPGEDGRASRPEEGPRVQQQHRVRLQPEHVLCVQQDEAVWRRLYDWTSQQIT